MIKNSQRFFNNIKEDNYSDLFYHFNTLLGLCQYEQLFEEIEKLKSDNKKIKILDWGCGNGWFSYYLIKNGFTDVVSYYYGWDDIGPAKAKIKELNVVNGEDYKLGNASLLPFEDGSFDVIFSIGVLEHVHETGGSQEASMAEITRVLKPNGSFYCFHFPNKYTWIEYVKGKIAGPKTHIHTKKFTRTDIEILTRPLGLQLAKVKRYNLLPYNVLRYISANNRVISYLYVLMDRTFSITPLNRLAQCYFFIARKARN